MNSKDRIEEKQTGQSDANTNLLRRRLIKASATTPLIATLTPSSALALSSAANCAGGDFSNKKFTKNGSSIIVDDDGKIIGGGDNAVRQAVDYWQKVGPNVPGLPNKVYLIDGLLYDQAGNSYPKTDENMAKLNSSAYEADTAYVLALYDVSDGEVTYAGLWPKVQIDDTYATPMTGSCWTSLAIGGAKHLGT